MSEQQQPVDTGKAESGQAVVDQYGLRAPTEQQKKYMYVIYIAYAIGFIMAPGMLIAVIVAYIKRKDMQGTVYASHINFILKTFWTGFILGIVGVLLFILVIGYFILLLVGIWVLIRIISGILKFLDGKPASSGWMLA